MPRAPSCSIVCTRSSCLGEVGSDGGSDDLEVTLLERPGPEDREPADTVLEEIDQRPNVQRLVIGMKRRSSVSKALLGSVAQRLLLDSPVLAVKAET